MKRTKLKHKEYFSKGQQPLLDELMDLAIRIHQQLAQESIITVRTKTNLVNDIGYTITLSVEKFDFRA